MAEKDDEIKLTAKQQKFCLEYLIDLNGTQAAIRAGYSKDTAGAIAHENLKKPEIEARIIELRRATADKLDITRERIAQEYARIAFADIRELYNTDNSLKSINDLGDDAAAVIASIEVDEIDEWKDGEKKTIGYTTKVKRWDKKAALDSLCKIFGYNAPEKTEHSGTLQIATIIGMEIK